MNIEIANRLYEYRKANGFSQEELAEKIGVSRQAISKWERSESSPDTDNLIALAKLYNVSLDEMINGSSTPAKVENAPAAEPVNPTPAQEAPQAYAAPVYYENNQNYSQQYTTPPVEQEKEKKKAPWISGAIWLGGLILFLLIGAVFPSGWSVSWIILLLIPAIDTGVDAVINNNAQKFAYPLLVTALFCALGMGFSLWHPAWVLFLTIPVYYIVADSFTASKKQSDKKSPLFITAAIIISIVMCSTVGIVCDTAMNGRSSKSTGSSIGSVFNYDNESAYQTGGASVPAQEINSVQINWVSGSISVTPDDSATTITFSETPQDNKDMTLRYLVENGTLKIQFCKAHTTVKSLKDLNKDLVITVPAKVYEALDIDDVSADININSLDINNLQIDNVSGKIDAIGKFSNVDINNVSGDMLLDNSATNGNVDVDTVSGDITVKLPKNIEGFRAEYDSVSGSADCDSFNAVKDSKSKTIIAGNASSVSINFDSVSGNLKITSK